jgi:hypothetical protein
VHNSKGKNNNKNKRNDVREDCRGERIELGNEIKMIRDTNKKKKKVKKSRL